DIKVDNKRAYLGRVAEKIWTRSSATIIKDTITALTSEPQAQVDKNNLKIIAGKVFNSKIQIGAYKESRYAYIL
ncbi:type 1 fimbrial protein, partial [Proteus mirabilis]|nr:type 1 fimbrial protein [Proteus mirabilis]